MATLRAELRRLADERVALLEGNEWGASAGQTAYSCLWDLVAREGAEYRPVPIPSDLRRRQARSGGKCFDRAFSLALERSDLFYVEGFAGKHGLHHAWLTSGKGDAIDLAWGYEPESEYLGVGLTTQSIGQVAVERNQVGGFLETPALLQRGFGDSLLEQVGGES